MSYDGFLSFLGLSQSQVETMLIYGIMALIAGLIIIAYWQVIALGAVALGMLTVFLHHPHEDTPVVKQEVDENYQKTGLNAGLLIGNVIRFNSEPLVDNTVVQTPKTDDTPVVETEEMKLYVKNCTELTGNKDLCYNNWVEASKSGGELVLDPVERPKRTKKTVKVERQVQQSHVTEVKLLDVDNKEYKERRATALAKPGAIVMRETYH